MNRMNRFAHLSLVGVVLALFAGTAAHAMRPGEMKILEHAAESPYLDLALTTSDSGTVRTRRCDHCPMLTLRVDGNTVVRQGGTRLSLSDAELNRDRGATVFFDPETLIVTRILLRQ